MTPPATQKPKGTRTGSNLRGNPLLAHQTKLLTKARRSAASLARENQQLRKPLFYKTDLRLAARIAAEVNDEFRTASVKAGGSAQRLAGLMTSARQKLQRRLARAFPDFRKLQTLQRQYLRELAEATAMLHLELPHDLVHLDWGNLVNTARDWEEFTAPFGYFACDTVDPDSNIRTDQSFVFPERGYVVNSLVFKQSEDTPAIIGLYGLHVTELASNQASCGIRYRMPEAGRLRISGTFQNYGSELRYSIDDKFGFSSARLEARVELFVALVRPSGVTYLPTTLFTHRIDSDGAHKSYLMPRLDIAQPYTVYATSPELFAAGENVQVMIGSAVNISGLADDMVNEVRAYFEWRVDKITVEVV